MLKLKILELLDQLLDLFEDKNKLIYRKLIYHHHYLHNIMSDDDLKSALVEWTMSNNIDQKISRRDKNILYGTRFELEGEWVFNDLTRYNIDTIWKWVDVIISDLADNN